MVVGYPKLRPASEIDRGGLDGLMVLRCIAQMEVARLDDIVASSQLPAAQVESLLYFASRGGWVLKDDSNNYQIAPRWYRTVTRLLSRRNLLVPLATDTRATVNFMARAIMGDPI